MADLVPVVEVMALRDPELDKQIADAQQAGDITTLAVLLPQRLDRYAVSEEYFVVLQARDLYLIREYRAWDTDTYHSFAQWVQEEYARQPRGKEYSHVANLVSAWEFYAVEQGWSVEEMARATISKLIRGKGTAIATMLPDRTLDPVMKEVLLDDDVNQYEVTGAYDARKAVDEDRPLEDMDVERPLQDVPLYTFYTENGEYPQGTLTVLLPEHRNGQRAIRILGVLDGVREQDLASHIIAILRQARVRIL